MAVAERVGEAFNQVRVTTTVGESERTLFHPIGLGTDYDCSDDVKIGNNYVTVRHGDNRDLHAFYGIKSDGQIVGTGVHIFDGQHHNIEPDASSFVIRAGNNKDVLTRFCFSDAGWEVSVPEARNGASAGPCNSSYPASLYSD